MNLQWLMILGFGILSSPYILSPLSSILWGDNSSIDTTDKARAKAGGKQLDMDNTYTNWSLKLRNVAIDS